MGSGGGQWGWEGSETKKCRDLGELESPWLSGSAEAGPVPRNSCSEGRSRTLIAARSAEAGEPGKLITDASALNGVPPDQGSQGGVWHLGEGQPCGPAGCPQGQCPFLASPVTASPCAEITMDNSLLAIVVATASSAVFIMAILLLLLHQREPQCCQVLCTCHFFWSPSQHDCPPPYLSTMGHHTEVQPVERSQEFQGIQGAHGGEVFCVGLPRSHQLPLWQPARLPSYESVRKKDRQQHIHQLIAQSFGLWACRELPPSYEEAIRSPTAPAPSCGSTWPSQEAATCPAQGSTTV
ncbi:uncharacterized protein LOC108591821 isoform X1 [Callithrix jacchus]|uniref:uncharacterized protein LOC108591821 isoform X1 n=1 Tax=Callithrix jacchus TaxID=9483 RepID=UPI00083FF50F|nr:uncharacterized protein LOC108591821 isoform X1 [Callithrix jacchus]